MIVAARRAGAMSAVGGGGGGGVGGGDAIRRLADAECAAAFASQRASAALGRDVFTARPWQHTVEESRGLVWCAPCGTRARGAEVVLPVMC